jgi:hypothetical protein
VRQSWQRQASAFTNHQANGSFADVLLSSRPGERPECFSTTSAVWRASGWYQAIEPMGNASSFFCPRADVSRRLALVTGVWNGPRRLWPPAAAVAGSSDHGRS